jgi:hypothetical protein
MIAVPGCARRLRRLLRAPLHRASSVPGADRYRKRFTAAAHLRILVGHALRGSPSLRQSHAVLAATDFAGLGLPHGLSLSQLARSSTSRDPACFEALLVDLVVQARRLPAPSPEWRLLQRVHVLDSTFLALSARRSPWGRSSGRTFGVRLQLGLDLARRIPASLRLTLANAPDQRALAARDLTDLVGWTVVVDLGYYGHASFARLRAAGVHLLSRLHPQAVYRVTATRSVPVKRTVDGDTLVADETIDLGSPNNRAGTVIPNLRLITCANTHGITSRLVTDRFDLTAVEVVRLYRKRWQIELFFRWLKRQLGGIQPLGTSRAAVWLGVLVGAIAAVLALLIEADRPAAVSRIAWLHALATTLLPPVPAAPPDG